VKVTPGALKNTVIMRARVEAEIADSKAAFILSRRDRGFFFFPPLSTESLAYLRFDKDRHSKWLRN